MVMLDKTRQVRQDVGYTIEVIDIVMLYHLYSDSKTGIYRQKVQQETHKTGTTGILVSCRRENLNGAEGMKN